MSPIKLLTNQIITFEKLFKDLDLIELPRSAFYFIGVGSILEPVTYLELSLISLSIQSFWDPVM